MNNSKINRIKDLIFQYVGIICTFLGLIVLSILLFNIVKEGFLRIDWDFLTSLPSRKADKAGIFTAWIGSIWILVFT